MMQRTVAAGLALATVLFGSVDAVAASCTRLSANQTKPSVDNFNIRPEGMLERYPQGGLQLASSVAFLAAADTDTRETIAALLRLASPLQKRAIGEGLGRAAGACVVIGRQDEARRLSDSLRQRGEPEAFAAFMAAYQPITPSASSPAAPRAVETGGRLMGRGVGTDTNVFRDQLLADPLRPIQPIR